MLPTPTHESSCPDDERPPELVQIDAELYGLWCRLVKELPPDKYPNAAYTFYKQAINKHRL